MKVLRHGLAAVAIFALALSVTATRGYAAAPLLPTSAVVTTDGVNLRSGPATDYPVVGQLNQGDEINPVDQVAGQQVDPGNTTWYRLPSGRYIYSAFVADSNTSAGSSSVGSSGQGSGRMIEIDLAAHVAKAIENGQVIYTALVVIGRPATPTPTGTFHILRRVYDETMDSSTIGIPNNGPGGYYLTGVLFTQYFTNDGAAIHYNYWTPLDQFGHTAATHGCVGLDYADAQFFWNFASVGTPVVINP